MIDKNYLVSKHNELVEAHYRLSLQEQRLIAFMCSAIHPDDEDFKAHGFKIRDLADLIGLKGENYYSRIKAVTRRLLSRVLQIETKDSVLQVSWLESAEYFEDKGYVELCFSPKLKPYLLCLKNCFTQYRLDKVLSLRSKYAFRLYELCKKNELLGFYEYDLERLRKILGIGEGELTRWYDVKKYAIEPAIKEINSKTELKVSFRPYKKGRSVAGIRLHVEEKSDAELEKITEKDDASLEYLVSLIPEKHRKKKTILKALKQALRQHDKAYCERNIRYANEKATRNYRVFLCKALQHDWSLGWWEDQEARRNRASALNQVRNARVRYNGQELTTDENGFLYLGNRSVFPPETVLKLVGEGKIEVIE